MIKSLFAAAILFASAVHSEPQIVSLGLKKSLKGLSDQALQALKQTPTANPGFNAIDQIIDVTGNHEWRAPGPKDARGPCPGLNALANHGFLPRSGFATIFEFVAATNQVYGMATDLATILSVFGAVFDGVGLGWSIAGGFHTGIGGSHGHYEVDNSPTRGDLHQYGSNSDLVMSQFKRLYNLQPNPATANYNIDVMSEFRHIRFNQSIAENPVFYYPPFAGTAVTQAAFAFIYRFMANHTQAAPQGILTRDILKSFFAISGEGASMKWTKGHERIPSNWHRRAKGDEYSFSSLRADGATFAKRTPELTKPGCNQGTVNSYVPIDTSSTNYDFTGPTDGVCYAIAQMLRAQNNLPAISTAVVQVVLLPFQNALGCVGVPSTNQSVGEACPGYSFYGGPNGAIAPGAIRS